MLLYGTLAAFDVAFADQGFEEIVVGVVERNVDAAVVRDAAHRVLEKEAAIRAEFGAVRGCRKGGDNLVCGLEVVAVLSVLPEFIKGRCHDCAGRGVSLIHVLFIRRRHLGIFRGVIIPKRDEILRHILLIDKKVGDMLGLLKIARLFRVAVGGGVAVERPRLAS